MFSNVGFPAIFVFIPWLISIFLIVFSIYFLFKVLDFMRTKSEQDAMLLEKLDRLIQLQKKKEQRDL
jgi:hypothetical protein